jgi:hypothetical protein
MPVAGGEGLGIAVPAAVRIVWTGYVWDSPLGMAVIGHSAVGPRWRWVWLSDYCLCSLVGKWLHLSRLLDCDRSTYTEYHSRRGDPGLKAVFTKCQDVSEHNKGFTI